MKLEELKTKYEALLGFAELKGKNGDAQVFRDVLSLIDLQKQIRGKIEARISNWMKERKPVKFNSDKWWEISNKIKEDTEILLLVKDAETARLGRNQG